MLTAATPSTHFCSSNRLTSPPHGQVEQKAYRMTMEGVYDLNEKNTGDVSGDMSFVLGQRVHAYMCRQQPNSIQCANLARKKKKKKPHIRIHPAFRDRALQPPFRLLGFGSEYSRTCLSFALYADSCACVPI